MLFIWVFLPIVLAGHYLLWKTGGIRAANVLLLLASLIFYAWGEPVYILLMLISISVNWAAGRILEITQYKKTVLTLDVMVNLGLLLYFKYAGMAVRTFNIIARADVPVPEIALPIGISFFTFQALSYVIDVYRGEVEVQRSWFTIALYVSFFPQLIAGPIVKYKDVNRQISDRKIDLEQTALGMRRFTYGLAKKVLIANVMGHCADRIYALPISDVTSPMVWIASAAYTLQIYYDFSGYSDMAIGLGKMFGFQFRENFRYPYTSCSIREFWRRWHISLSSWFRDYVYIPLGGNRRGEFRTYINLFIVFLLTGIWHGASWTFVFWGLYHGFFSIIERLGVEKLLRRVPAFSWLYTILVVNFGWVFFRVDHPGSSIRYILRMVQPWKYTVSSYSILELVSPKMILFALLGILGAGGIQRHADGSRIGKRWKFSWLEIIYCCIIFILSLLSLAGSTYNPFIYFRF